MPIFAETEQKIFGDILFDLIENTNLTRSSPGSKTRAVAQAVSKKLGRMWTQFDLNIVQSFLQGAEGKYLNFIGSMMNVERLGETTARISSSDRVIRFFTAIGTFGTINSGNSITIPAGTLVSTLPGGEGVLYTVPFTTILPSDQAEFFVTVESVSSGTRVNVGAKTLIYHNFTTYSDAVNNTLQVTNDSEIFVARNVESDTNYRFRIANSLVGSEQANETAIRLSALIVPGVADIVLLPYQRGIGTFDLLIKATTPRVPEGLIEAVNESVAKTAAYGEVPKVRGPREIGMSVIGSLILRRKLSASEQSNLLRAVTDNVINYINNLDIGEEFIVNEVVERVLSTSDEIKNIGTANQPLDSVFIYRTSSLEDNKVRETLISDFRPDSDEKIFVEDRFAGGTPVLFRIAA